MSRLQGLLRFIGEAPGAVMGGLLGPSPIPPELAGQLPQGYDQQARQQAINNMSMQALTQPRGQLGNVLQGAQQGYQGSLINMLRGQEMARIQQEKEKENEDLEGLRRQMGEQNLSRQALEQMRLLQVRQEMEGAGGGIKTGQYNPGDYTPESYANFLERVQSGVPEPEAARSLRRWVSPDRERVIMIGNVPHAYKPGMAPAPLSDLPTEAAGAQVVEGAKTTGRANAETLAKSQAEFPKVESNGTLMIDTLARLSGMNLNLIYGVASVAPIIPGTPQADAAAVWEQLQGQAFLKAFETLKGGGQITEVEGTKATAAITRLANRQQSPEAAREAIAELTSVVERGIQKAREQAGIQTGLPGIGTVESGYEYLGGDPSDSKNWRKR